MEKYLQDSKALPTNYIGWELLNIYSQREIPA